MYRLALVYVLLGVVVLRLLVLPFGRRVLAFLVATATPVLGFALVWQGGDLERYIALYSALFLAVAAALQSVGPVTRTLGGLAVVALLSAFNLPGMYRSTINEACEATSRRLAAVLIRGTSPVLVVAPHQLDEIAAFDANCPKQPLAAGGRIRVIGLVMANHGDAPRWRLKLAREADSTWDSGGQVWVATRALAPRPHADWKWVEGEDPLIHWRDFPAFLSPLEFGKRVGGDDGFIELLDTARNRSLLINPRG